MRGIHLGVLVLVACHSPAPAPAPWTPVTATDRHSVAIGEVESAHRDEMQACFRDLVQEDLSVAFEVARDGSISNISFTMPSALEHISNATQVCLRAVLESIRFPPGGGEPIYSVIPIPPLHRRPPATLQ
jgi:hypothetical protein